MSLHSLGHLTFKADSPDRLLAIRQNVNVDFSKQCLSYMYSLRFTVSLSGNLEVRRGGESRALSSCSGTRLWPFHVDDWFRCGEEGEEGSGLGLCPLITLYYHTGGIYHQTPKASVHGGTVKPISSLTCNPSRSTKSSIVECYHIHFLQREGGCSREKVAVWGDCRMSPWKAFCDPFFNFIQSLSPLWRWYHIRPSTQT